MVGMPRCGVTAAFAGGIANYSDTRHTGLRRLMRRGQRSALSLPKQDTTRTIWHFAKDTRDDPPPDINFDWW